MKSCTGGLLCIDGEKRSLDSFQGLPRSRTYLDCSNLLLNRVVGPRQLFDLHFSCFLGYSPP